ncbi:MAG: efflux RND transporter periplasmic adaptor subunit [bacterium]|nr:efflux RND transporter periplasmic adaptor subunit [bacterium]
MSNPEQTTTDASNPSGLLRRTGSRLVLVALLIAGAWAAFANGEAPPPPAVATEAIPVRLTDVVVLDAFEVRDRIAGRVTSRRRSEVGFERGGRLAEILVDEGDRVEAGALLAKLDTRALEAERREQRARMKATEARLELARVTAKRQRRLAASGTLSAQSLDEALTEEASLEAQLAADRAALERTAVALSLSRIEAPYPAVVVRRQQDEGNVATPGTPVLSLIEDGAREVRLGVPPEVAASLEPGRTYEVEGSAGTLRATLRHVLPELDRETRTRAALFEIDAETDDPLRVADGTLVWVRVTRSVPSRGAWVPMAALAEGRRGTWTLFAVREDAQGVSRTERRVVEIVHAEGDAAFVRGTLETNDRIVADGMHRLIPGLAVTPVGEAG